MSRYFVLLEITDPAVKAFLWSVRSILTGSSSRSPIHITLRGPYETEDSRQQALELTRATLGKDVLLIAGVGRFSNPNEDVVYFKVDSPNLRQALWKPDFPVRRFGSEPHISVYRGSDAAFADLVATFLSDQQIAVACAEYRLVWHKAAQPNLFSSAEPAVGDMMSLVESTRIDMAVLDGLREVVHEYRAQRFPRVAG